MVRVKNLSLIEPTKKKWANGVMTDKTNTLVIGRMRNEGEVNERRE